MVFHKALHSTVMLTINSYGNVADAFSVTNMRHTL